MEPEYKLQMLAATTLVVMLRGLAVRGHPLYTLCRLTHWRQTWRSVREERVCSVVERCLSYHLARTAAGACLFCSLVINKQCVDVDDVCLVLATSGAWPFHHMSFTASTTTGSITPHGGDEFQAQSCGMVKRLGREHKHMAGASVTSTKRSEGTDEGALFYSFIMFYSFTMMLQQDRHMDRTQEGTEGKGTMYVEASDL